MSTPALRPVTEAPRLKRHPGAAAFRSDRLRALRAMIDEREPIARLAGMAGTVVLASSPEAVHVRPRPRGGPRVWSCPRVRGPAAPSVPAARLQGGAAPVPPGLRVRAPSDRGRRRGRLSLPARRDLCIVSPYAMHRRPDIWPEPDRFDPDRFTPEAEASRPRGSYFPFSLGPRTCIGNHFALMEGPIVLATLLRRADFELTDPRGSDADAQATLRPKGGIPMRVKLRGESDSLPLAG